MEMSDFIKELMINTEKIFKIKTTYTKSVDNTHTIKFYDKMLIYIEAEQLNFHKLDLPVGDFIIFSGLRTEDNLEYFKKNLKILNMDLKLSKEKENKYVS